MCYSNIIITETSDAGSTVGRRIKIKNEKSKY